MNGLDRRAIWLFSVRVRGARRDPAALPEVTIAVDGVTQAARRTTNAFETIEVRLPTFSRGRRGAEITLSVSPTFVPGPQDPRELGVMISRLAMHPESGIVLPPPSTVGNAMVAAGLFGIALGLLAMTAGSALAGAGLIALAQAVPISQGFAPYSGYAASAPLAAAWMVPALVIGIALVEVLRRERLRQTARFAAALAASALYLRLLVLLHPDMYLGDAMFHAHRYEYVLAGRYFFTSITPGSYEFPYAIALYVFALPFSALAHGVDQHVALLRIVVAAVDAVAALLVYPMVVRAWGDRLAAAIAVALYLLAPLDFRVQTVGNLTNAFGQSLALAGVALITTGWIGAQPALNLVWLAVVLAAAFLSHTSTVAMLFPLILCIGALYWWRGGPVIRQSGVPIMAAAVAALGLAVVLYYGRFTALYGRELARIGAEAAAPGIASGPTGQTVAGRAILVPRLAVEAFGWPLLMLAGLGVVRLWHVRRRDRLTLVLMAWAMTCGVFLALGILTPIDMRYYLAALPALAIAGAGAASWLWQAAGWARAAAVALLGWLTYVGAAEWIGSIR
ncbi:MAG: hypothetical protein HYX76_04615 [Acidobacteria bacterium]|nr:hypothetical protein [Acidobacteriota bacterium]